MESRVEINVAECGDPTPGTDGRRCEWFFTVVLKASQANAKHVDRVLATLRGRFPEPQFKVEATSWQAVATRWPE